VLVKVVPAKVAIKQRLTKGGHNNSLGPGVNGSKLNPSKSVEERKEEYNKVRSVRENKFYGLFNGGFC